MLFHETDGLNQRRSCIHRNHITRHHLTNMAGMRGSEFACLTTRAEYEIQPGWPYMSGLSLNLSPVHQVSFRQDADKRAMRIHHREAADVFAQHAAHGVYQGGVRRCRDDVSGHGVADFHGSSPVISHRYGAARIGCPPVASYAPLAHQERR